VLASSFKTKLAEMGVTAPVFLETTVVDDKMFQAVKYGDKQSNRSLINILYMSRLEKDKGLMEAITSISLLAKQYPNCVFSVAGSGAEKDAAIELTKELGLQNVRFIGYVDGERKAKAFEDADIFFFPTFYGEGMPNSVLEAMACGLPVVTRSVGGISDFFENGRMGFVTNSEQPAVFSELLANLMHSDSLRKTIGTYNRSYARDHFSASEVVQRLEVIYCAV